MKRETLDKLREYIDLAAAQAQAGVFSLTWFPRDAGRGQLWQVFVDAALAEEDELPDEVIALHHAVADLME